ncbi:MAG: CapA family protein [Trichodesmium sp.]
MSHEEILTRAKQGDPTAITFLINEKLNNIGVKARVNLQKNNLHILLEGSQLPDAQTSTQMIEKGMQRLNPLAINFVNLYGRRLGKTTPEWTEVIELEQPEISHRTEVGRICCQPENIKYSQESSTSTLSKKVNHNPEIIQKKQKQRRDSSPIYINQTVAVKSHFLPKEKLFSGNSISGKYTKKKNKLFWLLASAIGIVLIPISSLVLSSQTDRTFNIISNTSAPAKTPELNTPVVEISKPLPSTIPTPTPQNTLNPEITTTENQLNLSEVSEFLLSSIKSPINPDTRITIKAVGDIIPGTNFPRNKLHPKKEQLFTSVTPLLQDADIVFGNFESTLTSYPKSRKRMGSGRVFAFRTPPDYKYLLKDAGFNVLSVANNHSFDFFKRGFEDTINNIQSIGMEAVGRKGEIIYRQVKGINIAFIAFSNYSYHNSMLDLESAKKLVQEADEKADIIVISVHAGAEGTRALRIKNKTEYFFGENRGNKVLFARTLIDEGADLILGHGPHVPRAMEVYQGKLIAYSLGNFMGYRTLSSKGKLGYSLVLELDVNPRGDFVSGKILPVHLNSKGVPYPDKLSRSIKLIRELTKKDFPKTMLEINSKGEITINN